MAISLRSFALVNRNRFISLSALSMKDGCFKMTDCTTLS
jgi:hypothetical protein